MLSYLASVKEQAVRLGSQCRFKKDCEKNSRIPRESGELLWY